MGTFTCLKAHFQAGGVCPEWLLAEQRGWEDFWLSDASLALVVNYLRWVTAWGAQFLGPLRFRLGGFWDGPTLLRSVPRNKHMMSGGRGRMISASPASQRKRRVEETQVPKAEDSSTEDWEKHQKHPCLPTQGNDRCLLGQIFKQESSVRCFFSATERCYVCLCRGSSYSLLQEKGNYLFFSLFFYFFCEIRKSQNINLALTSVLFPCVKWTESFWGLGTITPYCLSLT